MNKSLLTMEVRLEPDVVLARQRARQIAGLLGFENQDQARIATAVSEIARNAFQYAGGGRIEFLVDGPPEPALLVRVSDRGPGFQDLQAVLDGRYVSTTGMGVGVVGTRRLMDRFQVESTPGKGAVVLLGKNLPRRAPALTPATLARVAEDLSRRSPQNPFDEVRQQNQDLLHALEELTRRQEELSHLNRELADTNRGVVALYAELDEKADYLRRASEMKSRFLSNMSHEFRTPLNSIMSLARILLDRTDGELLAEQEKQVTYIRKAAEDLTELVNDLLDLAKVEAGKVVLRPMEFKVGSLFGALRGMLKPLLAHHPLVALTFDDPPADLVLNTDETKVSQVVRNFISNALKFTERGEVRVTAAAGPGDTVVFAVIDTGIGIAPEDQEVIFQEFTQLESARQKRVKGTGLGLPLSRRLAELLGGGVSLRSAPGIGSTFALTVPRVYRGPAEVSFAPEVSHQVDPTRLPVLVVEDNRETLFIYEKYLRGTGFQVIPARTVRAARRVLEEIRPIAVVLDILLEGESAWELIAELKRSTATKALPVWVVTMVDNQHKARALGADDFCVKPVERSWLLDRLQEAAASVARDRMLIIDDDEVSRYLLKGLLADTRFEVREARDGEEGIRLAAQEKPCAIFLDLDMPGRNGFEVLQSLRTAAATRDIPVIIHTARVLEESERQALGRGAVAILPKEAPSREAAQESLRQALARAGLGPRRRGTRMTSESPTILLVDDTEASRYAVGRILLKANYNVREAATGHQALLAAPGSDLIILDIRLPDMNGREVCQRLKADPATAATPVLHLSASFVQSEDRSEGLEGGTDGYLTYPLEPRELLATVQALLRIRSAERTVRAQSELLRVTLSSIGEGVIATDQKGLVTFINPVAQTLTGWGEEAVGCPLHEVFHIVSEKTGLPAENPAARVIRTGKTVGLANHTVLLSRDGTRRPIDDSAAPIRSAEEGTVGMVLVFRDITERRRLEAEVQQQAENLADRDRRKDEFLAMLAHELRNPLGPITNSLHYLRIRFAGNPDFEQLGGLMGRQLAHLARLVDDLMDVSRITRGKVELRKERVNLGAVMANAAEAARSFLAEREHRLELTLPPGAVVLDADPARLEQVLTNLLNNAGKYTPPGGVIRLAAGEEAGQAVVRVRDNGIGIRPEMMPRLFEMFQQADRIPGRVSEGLGIGLSLVQSLVEMHGGSIEAHSAGVGQGSEFVVRLPLAADREDPRPAPAAEAGGVRPRRILAVDDNVDGAKSLALVLTLEGHEVRVAHDGPGALEVAAAFLPDVVLLDIGLPKGMNGYEVARRLRKQPGMESALFLAVTGYGQQDDRQQSREAGFSAHLVKPLDLDYLRELLART